jgi:uncharacterized ferritin-like protein (DUF455 family)
MNLFDYCEHILFCPKIEEKLLAPSIVSCFKKRKARPIPTVPSRDSSYKFSKKRVKFPKAGSLTIDKNKALALHFFANHELLAIEMMAAAILKFSDTVNDVEFKKISIGILSAIKDEQKHFKLYEARFNELGFQFGDVPVNDFFWRYFNELNSFEEFFSVMSLTFEAANLDFAHYYGNVFRKIGDEKTANILDIIYKDELKHVQLGAFWVENLSTQKTLWDAYNDCLPNGITPARSKGISFDLLHRKKANLPKSFIENLESFEDDFRITNRRK